MDNKKLSEKKQELMKPDWTETLHHELQELPLQEAKWIVENMTDSEIFSKVNNRRFQEDYISDNMDYEYGPITVPEGSIFVMGDNRNLSFDSHAWSDPFVPIVNVKGKAFMIYGPTENFGTIK